MYTLPWAQLQLREGQQQDVSRDGDCLPQLMVSHSGHAALFWACDIWQSYVYIRVHTADEVAQPLPGAGQAHRIGQLESVPP